MIQQTTLNAYKEVKTSLGARQKIIYDCLKIMQPATNLMIAQRLGIPINYITPRMFELREKKLVGVAFQNKCKNSGRWAIYWRVVKEWQD